VILYVLGTVLTMLGSPIENILAYYGLYFLLTLPLTRLRARTLAWIAGALVIAGPALSFLVRVLWGEVLTAMDAVDPVTRLGGESIIRLLFTGNYPAATWLPFVVAGMALGRLELGPTVAKRLAVAGSVLALAGYGGSWVALRLAGDPAETRETPWKDVAFSDDEVKFGAEVPGDGFGVTPTDSPRWLLVSEPHTGTPFDVAASLGIAIVVLALALLLTSRIRRVLTPLTAVGTMSLTAYIGHIAVIAILGEQLIAESPTSVYIGLVAGIVLFCALWARFLGRGPWERFLHAASSKPANLVRGGTGSGWRMRQAMWRPGRRGAPPASCW